MVITFVLQYESFADVTAGSELFMGWVNPRARLGWAGLGWVEIFQFQWVGSVESVELIR